MNDLVKESSTIIGESLLNLEHPITSITKETMAELRGKVCNGISTNAFTDHVKHTSNASISMDNSDKRSLIGKSRFCKRKQKRKG